MNKMLVAVALLCSGLFANEAKAVFCDMASCAATSITIDAGEGTGKSCKHNTAACECGTYYTECGIGPVRRSYCNPLQGWGFNHGAMVGGGSCCGWDGACPSAEEVAKINAQLLAEEAEFTNRPYEDVVAQFAEAKEAGLNKVFGAEFDDSRLNVDIFYGWVDQNNRSPSNGRTTSAKARLDACLFYTDADAIEAAGGTTADKLARCYGSTYGCGTVLKNEHCNATGTNDGVGGVAAAVCKDRCDCIYGGSCQNY